MSYCTIGNCIYLMLNFCKHSFQCVPIKKFVLGCNRLLKIADVTSFDSSSSKNLVKSFSFSKRQMNSNSSVNNMNVTLVACGSFNPITFMHLRMFELAKDYIHEHHPNYTVKSGFISPVGDKYSKPDLVNGEHRKNMCQLAVSSSDWIKVMTWELEQPEWTPTSEVLDHFEEFVRKNDNEQHRVMYLCGADLIESFSTKDLWLEKDLRNIVEHHGLVVITRPSYDVSEIIKRSDLLSELQEHVFVVSEYFRNDVSSTKVREALRKKKSIKYIVPDSVADYITKHDLYSTPPAPVTTELAPLAKYKSNT